MSDFFGQDEPPEPEDRTAPKPQSVSQLLFSMRQFVEAHFHDIWIEGEISNWTHARSGHVYFSLRDDSALVNCVMWRTTAERMLKPGKGESLGEGDMVEIKGRISVYEPRGQIQLVVSSLKPVGSGLLYQKFLDLKEKLDREGLFDPAKKRPIPALPQRIGIVTSPTGAAIRDVLSVLERRAPGIEILIWPAKVQGSGAADEIRRGVEALGKWGQVDVILVTRGGGSLEDLWQFNDEKLAREIARCPVPVISAVGHEVDFTICDFVADLRAPTPSAAAEVVSENQGAVRDRIRELIPKLDRAIDSRLKEQRNRVLQSVNSWAFRSPIHDLETMIQRHDDLTARLDNAIDDRLNELKQKVTTANSALKGHNPNLILQKGYAIVRSKADQTVLTEAAKAEKVDRLSLEFRDGLVDVSVD